MNHYKVKHLSSACNRASDVMEYLDSNTLIYAANNLIAIYNPITHETTTLKGHCDKIIALKTYNDTILSASKNTLKIWKRVDTLWTCCQTINHHTDTITCIGINPSFKQLDANTTTIDDNTIKKQFATASIDNTILIYNCDVNGVYIQTQKINTSSFVLTMAFALLPHSKGIFLIFSNILNHSI